MPLASHDCQLWATILFGLSSVATKPSEACRDWLLSFRLFPPKWEKHLEWWKGESAGNYNDIAQFVHFVVPKR
jgi:hypothetical protein